MEPTAPALTAREAAVARRVQAWGTAALVAAAAVCAAATLGLAAAMPGAILAVPTAVGGLVGVLLLSARPGMGAALAVVLSLLLSGMADTIPAGKVIFGGYVAAYVTVWYGARWARGVPIVVSRTDVGAALLLVLGVFGGLALGLALGNRPADIVPQFQAFVPVLLYFPLKDTCARVRFGPEIIAGALVLVGVAAAVENALLTRQALSSATQLWQIIDVRVSYGEIMLMGATMIVTGLLVAARSWREHAFLLALFGIVVAGLILSKSRGFWVATILGLLVLLVASPAAERRRLVVTGTVGAGVLLVTAFAVAADYVMLIGTGIAKRFLTISTATTADVSLMNRFAENVGAWETVRLSPILGYGWGATYEYYSLISDGTQVWGFVHNAYLGLWLKIGLWGLGLVAWVWLGAIAGGLWALRDHRLSPRHRAVAGAAGAALVGIAIVANASSPFELADQMLALTTLWAVAQGTAQRARLSPLAAEAPAEATNAGGASAPAG